MTDIHRQLQELGAEMEAAWEEFSTRIEVPPDHPARAFGAAPHCHVVLFQHVSDAGGFADSVCVEVPEGLGNFDLAMLQAGELRARVMFLCNTREQADDIGPRAANALPEHRRISLERASAGSWGRTLDAQPTHDSPNAPAQAPATAFSGCWGHQQRTSKGKTHDEGMSWIF
jgi:hypothetical protein